MEAQFREKLESVEHKSENEKKYLWSEEVVFDEEIGSPEKEEEDIESPE
jgi:hypothetical protein